MSQTNRITWEPLRSFDVSTVTVTTNYYNVGTPLQYASYKLKMVNTSNQNLLVSINGTTSVDVCPANSFWLYDETQAQINTSSSPAIPAGTQISVNATTTTGTGSVYLVSQYIVQG